MSKEWKPEYIEEAPMPELTNWSDVADDGGLPEAGATKSKTFYQDSIPTVNFQEGDIWYDTNDNNHQYRANNSFQWVSTRDGTIATAQADATQALSQLSDIASDAKITPVEKLTIKPIWDNIVVEATASTGTLIVQAALFGVSSADLTTAYNTLNTYLNTTLTVFNDMTATTNITRATWDTNFKNYYTEKINLLNDISIVADSRALPSYTNLFGYWAFDETTGSVAYDTSGNGNNGTITTATYTDGISGTALSFNGSSGVVSVADNAAIQNIFDGGGSVSFWINPTDTGEGSVGKVLLKEDVTAVTGWFVDTVDQSGGNLVIRFKNQFSSTDGEWRTSTRIVPYASTTKTHIVITYNADSVSNDPIFYINGIVATLTEVATPVGTRVTDVGNALKIGNNVNDSSTFNGTIDEVMFFDTILTANQAKALTLSPGGMKDSLGLAAEAGADVTGNNTSADTTLVNTVAASQVQDRAEDDYLYGLFRGHHQDGLTESVDGGSTITRKPLNTRLITNTTGTYAKLYSSGLGFKDKTASTQIDGTYDYEFFIRASMVTGNYNFTFDKNAYQFIGVTDTVGMMINNGTADDSSPNILATNFEAGHFGFCVGNDNLLYAISGRENLGGSDSYGQDRTLITGITHTNENNLRILTHYNATYPTISNTGQVAPTSGTGATWSNISNAFDGDGNTAATEANTANVSYASLSWDGGTTYTKAKQLDTAGFTGVKQNYTEGGQYDTWGRTWTTTELNNTNFRLKLQAINDQNGDNNSPIVYRDFSFSLGSAVAITGILVDVLGQYSAPTTSHFTVQVTIYYTTSAYAGYAKFYVNDVLKATHTVCIPRTTQLDFLCLIDIGDSAATDVNSLLYNNYKIRKLT